MILEEYQSIFKVVFNDDSLRNLQVVKVRFCKIEPMLTRARLASSGDRLARESVDEITDKKSIKVKSRDFSRRSKTQSTMDRLPLVGA